MCPHSSIRHVDSQQAPQKNPVHEVGVRQPGGAQGARAVTQADATQGTLVKDLHSRRRSSSAGHKVQRQIQER